MVNDGLITHPSAALARPLQKGDPKFSDLMVEVVDFHRLGWLHPDIKPENFLVKKRPYYWDVAFRSPRPPPPVLRGLALLAFFVLLGLSLLTVVVVAAFLWLLCCRSFVHRLPQSGGKGSYCKNEKSGKPHVRDSVLLWTHLSFNSHGYHFG